MLMDNTADILLDNIMRVMSGEYFGQTKAAAIVGGKKKLERLIESGKIEAVKPRNSQNGKWFCNAAQVLMHCRNMRKTGKTGKKKQETRVRDKDCVKNRVKRAKIVRFTLC